MPKRKIPFKADFLKCAVNTLNITESTDLPKKIINGQTVCTLTNDVFTCVQQETGFFMAGQQDRTDILELTGSTAKHPVITGGKRKQGSCDCR